MIGVYTVGHGTLPADALAQRLTDAGIRRLADVRAFPGSRHNPQFRRREMERWLPEADVAYTWIRDLGGRREPVPGSRHVSLDEQAFRAYADYMETQAFRAGVDHLLTVGSDGPTTVMCSEAHWTRCHRRLIADHLVLVRGVEVHHLMHDGQVVAHELTDGVRLAGDVLVYDVGSTPPLALD